MKKSIELPLDYSPGKMDTAFADFQNNFPSFKKTNSLDNLRKSIIRFILIIPVVVSMLIRNSESI